MSDRTPHRPSRLESAAERRERRQLWETLRAGAVRPSRRDLMRWSAIAGAAATTARFGPAAVGAAPGRPPGGARRLYQEAEVQTGAEIRVPFDPFGADITLDPHRTTNSGGFWLMLPNVWGGLLRYNELGGVENDLAETHTVSDDGLEYTFKLRPDARYANGNSVLAEHFVSSWRRALDPDVTSPMAQFMLPVRGAQAYLAKESDELGFTASDETTVTIALEQPINYFLSYLAAFVWAVVDPAVLEAEGDGAFALADAGTGPWRFTEYETDVQFVMEPNENYYNGANPSIARIVWPIVSGPAVSDTVLTMYQNDEAISADVPMSLLEQVEGDPELAEQLVRIETQGTTRMIAMDFNQEPFNDVRVRRAIAQAVDRDQWANEIFRGTFVPTTSFIPPVVAETSGYEIPEGIGFDADAAQDALADAGFEDGEGLPEIVYYQNADDTQEEIDGAAALLQMIQDNAGITIQHDTSRVFRYLEDFSDLLSDNGGLQFNVLELQTVTDTPHLLSYAGRTDSPLMAGWYNWSADLEDSGDFAPGADAQQFDELTAEADVEQDEATRNDLYRQAEELLLKNAVYVPLGHRVQMYLQKPWIQGTRQGPWTGRLPVIFDTAVAVLVHDEATGEEEGEDEEE